MSNLGKWKVLPILQQDQVIVFILLVLILCEMSVDKMLKTNKQFFHYFLKETVTIRSGNNQNILKMLAPGSVYCSGTD